MSCIHHTHANACWCVSREGRVIIHMGWLQLVGSLKWSVSVAKEPCKRDYILQKRPIIWRSLLIEATPYLVYVYSHMYAHTVHTCNIVYLYSRVHARIVHTFIIVYVCSHMYAHLVHTYNDSADIPPTYVRTPGVYIQWQCRRCIHTMIMQTVYMYIHICLCGCTRQVGEAEGDKYTHTHEQIHAHSRTNTRTLTNKYTHTHEQRHREKQGEWVREIEGVRERDRERERDRAKEIRQQIDSQQEGELCVYVCVFVPGK